MLIEIARLINGIGTGMLNVIVPVWVCFNVSKVDSTNMFSLLKQHLIPLVGCLSQLNSS